MYHLVVSRFRRFLSALCGHVTCRIGRWYQAHIVTCGQCIAWRDVTMEFKRTETKFTLDKLCYLQPKRVSML